MLFAVTHPPISQMLATLDPDIVEGAAGEKPCVTYTRLASDGDRASIGNTSAEFPFPAAVTRPGVAFLPTSYVRRMLETFIGKEMILGFELSINDRGWAQVRFGDRRELIPPTEYAYFDKPSTAPTLPPASLDRSVKAE